MNTSWKDFVKKSDAQQANEPIGTLPAKDKLPNAIRPLAAAIENNIKDMPSMPDITPDERDIATMKNILLNKELSGELFRKGTGSSKSVKSVYPRLFDTIDSTFYRHLLFHPWQVPALLKWKEEKGEGFIPTAMELANGNPRLRNILYSGFTNNYDRVMSGKGITNAWDKAKSNIGQP